MSIPEGMFPEVRDAVSQLADEATVNGIPAIPPVTSMRAEKGGLTRPVR